MGSPNDTNEASTRKTQLSVCVESLRELSKTVVAFAKDAAKEQLIPAELQVVNCFFVNFLYFTTRHSSLHV